MLGAEWSLLTFRHVGCGIAAIGRRNGPLPQEFLSLDEHVSHDLELSMCLFDNHAYVSHVFMCLGLRETRNSNDFADSERRCDLWGFNQVGLK